MPEIIVIVHNIRSAHNVGSILRSAEGFGVRRVIISGYSPYPILPDDSRLPHIAHKLHSQISKTSLGAENNLRIEYSLQPPLDELRAEGYKLVALEQSTDSLDIRSYQAPDKLALLLGEEVSGIAPELLEKCDDTLEIPMSGQKESFNVSVATGIALYALTTSVPQRLRREA